MNTVTEGTACNCVRRPHHLFTITLVYLLHVLEDVDFPGEHGVISHRCNCCCLILTWLNCAIFI